MSEAESRPLSGFAYDGHLYSGTTFCSGGVVSCAACARASGGDPSEDDHVHSQRPFDRETGVGVSTSLPTHTTCSLADLPARCIYKVAYT